MKRMQHEVVLGVIPARLGSTRLARKMLADINGRPLIYHTWKRASKAQELDALLVATDSREIRDVVRDFGGEAVMTSRACKTGSDRVAEAVSLWKGGTPTIVVNIQGDEPMMPPRAINMVVRKLKENRKAVMSTVATPFTKQSELHTPNQVKVILDRDGNALYFSRSVIPHARTRYTKYLKHLGLYAFRTNFLRDYTKIKQTPLERAESLEQLRALENGYRIVVGVGNFKRVEVNTPEELAQARRLMRAR